MLTCTSVEIPGVNSNLCWLHPSQIQQLVLSTVSSLSLGTTPACNPPVRFKLQNLPFILLKVYVIGSSLLVRGTKNPSWSVFPALPNQCIPQMVWFSASPSLMITISSTLSPQNEMSTCTRLLFSLKAFFQVWAHSFSSPPPPILLNEMSNVSRDVLFLHSFS